MHLQSLDLLSYKNIQQASYEFDPKINAFVGNNGTGKTNTLDAIYHLSFGKSYFNPVTVQNINHEADFFLLDGRYAVNEKEARVTVSAKRGNKKMIKYNGKVYEKLSEHIGRLPLVIISPADRDLITEGSEGRRKFMDAVISQGSGSYLNDLVAYTRLLSQRNALLKHFAAEGKWDIANLVIYDEQMAPLAASIYTARKTFLDEFSPLVQARYNELAGSHETCGLEYRSDLATSSLLPILEYNRLRDRQLSYTSKGVHKDDLVFELNGHSVKKFGSQGQQKSYLVALKLAQLEFTKRHSGLTPILLLDDIFDKLDESRVEQLLNMVNRDEFGQIFISDTHASRTREVIASTHLSHKIFEL